MRFLLLRRILLSSPRRLREVPSLNEAVARAVGADDIDVILKAHRPLCARLGDFQFDEPSSSTFLSF